MALVIPEQFASTSKAATPRVVPRTILPKTFAAGTALLAVCTPIAFNTSTGFWVVWTSGGSNGTGTIKGFVFPDPVQLVAGGQVLGQVLLEGNIHRDDIPVPTGESQGNLDTSLKTGPRDIGLTIEGLDGVH